MTYVEIMKRAIKAKVDKEEKPDISLKDWRYICLSLMVLSEIMEVDGWPEEFQKEVVEILDKLEDRDYESRY